MRRSCANRRRAAEGRRRARPAAAPGAARQRSAERRDAILAAALDEFAARALPRPRLDDVAQRAGVAKGTIYLHFADKETLFQELIRRMLSRWSARWSTSRTPICRSRT